MRVAVISTDAPPMLGGIANHVSALTKSLRKVGVEVELFGGAAPRNTVANYIKSDISFSVNVTRQLLAYKPDLIHWHAIDSRIKPQRLWARMWPSVWTNHTSHFLQNTMAYKWEVNLPDAVIAPSREIKCLTELIREDEGIRETPQGKQHSVIYVPNGTDPNVFCPKRMREYTASHHGEGWAKDDKELELSRARHRPKDAWDQIVRKHDVFKLPYSVVMCPRRLESKNGAHYFVGAVQALQTEAYKRTPFGPVFDSFVLVGDYSGMYVNDGRMKIFMQTVIGWEDKSWRKGLQLDDVSANFRMEGNSKHGPILWGAVPYSEMPFYYQNSDIVVLPSLLEGTSLACLEAMASECCVVATRTGGLCDLITHKETGILVGAGSTQEIIKGIRYALDHPEERKAMGKRAREEVVSKYTWDHVAEYTAGIYRDVLARRTK